MCMPLKRHYIYHRVVARDGVSKLKQADAKAGRNFTDIAWVLLLMRRRENTTACLFVKPPLPDSLNILPPYRLVPPVLHLIRVLAAMFSSLSCEPDSYLCVAGEVQRRREDLPVGSLRQKIQHANALTRWNTPTFSVGGSCRRRSSSWKINLIFLLPKS